MSSARLAVPQCRNPGRGRDDLEARLDELAQRVVRLSPCRRDPERYHAEKSEIAFELRTLARSTKR